MIHAEQQLMVQKACVVNYGLFFGVWTTVVPYNVHLTLYEYIGEWEVHQLV